MSPAEAGAIELEEPDWRETFEAHAARWPKLPRYLAEADAFEATMRDWRRFHFTWIEDKGEPKRQPAGATEAIVALARLRIFPPRHIIKDVPRDGVTGYQCDDHMWLSISQESWRITAVEDRMLCLEKGFEEKPETKQIDLSRAKWGKYCEAAAERLEALKSQAN